MSRISDDELGNRIRSARLTAKVGQGQLAASLRVKPQTVWNWEHGKTSPSNSVRLQLEQLFPGLDAGAEPDTSSYEPLSPSSENLSEPSERFLDRRPGLKKCLYGLLVDFVGLGASEEEVQLAKKLLTSQEAMRLYRRRGRDDEPRMILLMESLGAGLVKLLKV